jgi:hypothetical protein
MTPEGAYLLRRHPRGGSFRAAWEAALALGVRRLEDVAMERALHGVEVPVYHFGAVVGSRRVYNDRLLVFLLRNRASERFAADSRQSAAERATLARLKREWRAEWERERARAESEENARTLDELDTMIDRMAANHRTNAALLLEDAREGTNEDSAAPADPESIEGEPE